MGFTSALYSMTTYLVRGHYVRGLFVGSGGRGCCRRGMLQVPTQGIAQWVERWSFVSMGEDME